MLEPKKGLRDNQDEVFTVSETWSYFIREVKKNLTKIQESSEIRKNINFSVEGQEDLN